MKKYIIFFIGLILQRFIQANPLTIINSMTSPTDVQLTFSIYHESLDKHVHLRKRVTVYPGSNFEYELHEKEKFIHITWSALGKVGSPDAWMVRDYSLSIQDDTPQLRHGGVLALSKGGKYMYDCKKCDNGVKFGEASVN